MNFLNAPRQPFVGLALSAAIGIVLADFFPFSSPLLVLALLVGAVAILIWSNSICSYALVGIGFFWIHAFQVTDSTGLRLAAKLCPVPVAATATGAVVSEPRVAPNGLATFLFRLRSIQIAEKQELTDATMLVRWRGHPEFGDELSLFGVADEIAAPRNPGEFDMKSYLNRNDVYRALLVRYPEDGKILRHGGGNPVLVAAHRSRSWIQAALCRGLENAPDVQNFISGIALGLRHQAPEDIEEPFQQTGTLHLFAVAGLHVGIVAQLLWMLATVAQLSRKWAATLIIPLVLFYAAVTGLHVSSVRAAIMSSILVGGLFFERKVFALNGLAAAAFVLLCCDTNEVFSTGFQLSFSVVGAILVLADPLFRMMRRCGAPDPFLPATLLSGGRRSFGAFFGWVCRGASVSVAAWIGSLPLIYWYFYLITPISLFANLAVVPLAFFILAVALLSILCAPISVSLSIIFNNANWFLAKLVLAIVHLFAQLPGGHHYLQHPHRSTRSSTTLTVLDVGAGAAAHLRSNGSDWLFDCASERNYERLLRSYLHSAGVNRLAGLMLSHGDSLHIGAARRLLEDLPPTLLIDNPATSRSIVHRRLHDEFERRGLRINGSDQLRAGEAKLRIVPPPLNLPNGKADDQTVIAQLTISRSTKVLLMSDSGYEREQSLLASGVDVRSDILIKGQHYSGKSGSDALLDAVQPKVVIATSRDFPAREKLNDEWVDHVRSRGIKLFRQDETGAVELRFGSEYWEARAYMTGDTFRSSSR